jgi:hypothetical protein
MAVRIATGEIKESVDENVRTKDPAAVALGRRGSLRGGKARADVISSDERLLIARRAAEKRWGRNSGGAGEDGE